MMQLLQYSCTVITDANIWKFKIKKKSCGQGAKSAEIKMLKALRGRAIALPLNGAD